MAYVGALQRNLALCTGDVTGFPFNVIICFRLFAKHVLIVVPEFIDMNVIYISMFWYHRIAAKRTDICL